MSPHTHPTPTDDLASFAAAELDAARLEGYRAAMAAQHRLQTSANHVRRADRIVDLIAATVVGLCIGAGLMYCAVSIVLASVVPTAAPTHASTRTHPYTTEV